MEHIRKVYEQEQEEQRSVQKIESVKKPWLPPLPEQIVSPYLQEIKDSRNFQKINLEVGVGLIDIPEEQRQVEYQIDPLSCGTSKQILIFFAPFKNTFWFVTIINLVQFPDSSLMLSSNTSSP